LAERQKETTPTKKPTVGQNEEEELQ